MVVADGIKVDVVGIVDIFNFRRGIGNISLVPAGTHIKSAPFEGWHSSDSSRSSRSLVDVGVDFGVDSSNSRGGVVDRACIRSEIKDVVDVVALALAAKVLFRSRPETVRSRAGFDGVVSLGLLLWGRRRSAEVVGVDHSVQVLLVAVGEGAEALEGFHHKGFHGFACVGGNLAGLLGRNVDVGHVRGRVETSGFKVFRKARDTSHGVKNGNLKAEDVACVFVCIGRPGNFFFLFRMVLGLIFARAAERVFNVGNDVISSECNVGVVTDSNGCVGEEKRTDSKGNYRRLLCLRQARLPG